MRLDKFNNPIFNDTDVFKLLYKKNTSVLPQLLVDINSEIENLENISDFQFKKNILDCNNNSIQEFDHQHQQQWFMPPEYVDFDVAAYCISKCESISEQNRVFEELSEFERLGMLNLLRWCKYFVDTCNENNIVWGVGRGSSVASFVLYKLGVHRIDSLFYNLDIHEFLR